jgi:hypothetical protein
MQYLFLIYEEEAKFAVMSPDEREAFVPAMLAYDEDLRRSGNYVTSAALKLPAEAVTVRMWDGRLATTDGPFAETKEHLSGFILVEARDLNEAIQLAARMPLARHASVEVRPIQILVSDESGGERP